MEIQTLTVGPCSKCETCYDGVKNQGESAIDCGGPCSECKTSFDVVKNQGETNIDCGGTYSAFEFVGI